MTVNSHDQFSKNEFIDAHAHLLWPTLLPDLQKVMNSAHRQGVKSVINIGVNSEEFDSCITLHEKYPNVFNGIGIHPEEAVVENPKLEIFTARFRKNRDHFIGIGEIGLDYYQVKDHHLRKKQEEVFRAQLTLAVELQKPVIIHCRDAEKPVIAILEEAEYSSIPGVLLHCFGGSQKYLERALTHDNWMFTIPTSVVYKKLHRILAMRVPIDRIMLETDSPFLKPYPELSRNEPQYVIAVAREIASLKDLSLRDVAMQTTANVKAFFHLADYGYR
ncbi:MAG: TatD family hydrolase [Promethearchaeota archaeon]